MVTGQGGRESEERRIDDEAEDGLSASFDWKLGQSDRNTASCPWGVIAFLALVGVLMLVIFASPGASPLSHPSLALGERIAIASIPLLFSASAVMAIVRSFGRSRYAWWGRISRRVEERLPSTRCLARAPVEFLPGLRRSIARPAVAHVAPYRLALVSQVYNPWVSTALFGIVALIVATGGAAMLLSAPVVGALVAAAVTFGGRTAFDQIPYAEIDAVSRTGTEVTVTLLRGPLAPVVVLRTKKEAAAKSLAARLQDITSRARQGGDAADDPQVAGVLRLLEERYEPS